MDRGYKREHRVINTPALHPFVRSGGHTLRRGGVSTKPLLRFPHRTVVSPPVPLVSRLGGFVRHKGRPPNYFYVELIRFTPSRFVSSHPIPVLELAGRTTRRGPVPEDFKAKLQPHRTAQGALPPVDARAGRFLRRPIAGVRPFYIQDIKFAPHRTVAAPPLHPAVLLGRTVRWGVSPDDVVQLEYIRFVLHRTAKSPPRPLDANRGHHTRHLGIPEDVGVLYQGPFLQTYEQGFRVADDSLALYELYVGVDGAPDFTLPPAETSPTLPFAFSPAPSTEYHLVVRQRNKYGLQSFNVFETVRTTDAGGTPLSNLITPPYDLALYDYETPGYLRVVSKYSKIDDLLPADTWDIYVKIWSDPVVGVDVAVASRPMAFFGVESAITYLAGPYTPGTTAHVLAVARRSSDGAVGVAGPATLLLAVPAVVPDTGPERVRVYDDVEGYIKVVAHYNRNITTPATVWTVYVDAVLMYTGPMPNFGGWTALNAIIGPFTPGSTVQVIVCAGALCAAAVEFTLALSLDLDDHQTFGGEAFEQL